MPLNRRELLATALAATGGVTLGGLGLPRVLETTRPGRSGRWGLPEESHPISVCGGCPAACSVRLRLVGGNAVGVSGSRLCPICRGGLCARGAAQVEAIYDPDRLVGPVKRAGARGEARWERQTWDEAMKLLAGRLRELGRAGRLSRVAMVLPPGGGVLPALARRFLHSIGSPHLYRSSGLRDPAAGPAASLAMGLDGPWSYDLANTDLLLDFGTPVLEGWLSPAWVSMVFGAGRARSGSRLRMIHVGSRFSETAGRADRWVPVKPGTEPILALGMANVLHRERRADSDFLRSWSAGFLPWKDGDGNRHASLTDLLRYAYSPKVVAEATGVPVPVILELARTFASAERPLAVGEQLGSTAGVFGLLAVNAINILVGRVMAPGGLLPPRPAPCNPLVEWQADPALGNGAERDSLVGLGSMPVRGAELWPVLGAVANGQGEPPFDVLMLFDGSVVGTLPPAARSAIDRIPMVVSFSTALDAGAALADLVLPAPTTFEQVNEVEPPPFDGRAHVAVSGRAMEPLLDTRPVGETILELARRLGGAPAAALPYKDVPTAVRHRLEGLHRARRGLPYGTRFQEDWTRQMEEAGLWTSGGMKLAGFLSALFERGGWTDPVVHYGNPGSALGHPDHRYHFHGLAARERARTMPLAFPVEDTDDAWMPHPEAVNEDGMSPSDFELLPFPVRSFSGQGSPNLPSLFEQAGPTRGGTFTSWVELNPQDAKRLRIEQGGIARLVSPHGELALPVHIQPGIAPGCAAVPLALSELGGGRWSRLWDGGAEDLLGDASGALVGSRLGVGTRVRIEGPAGGLA